MQQTADQGLYSGLIRLHILHHASEKPVYGLWIIEELGRHGYKLSAGTLYPLLHRLETRGLLRSATERVGRRSRRVYGITVAGEQALSAAKQKVKELFGELFESELQGVLGHGRHDEDRTISNASAMPARPGRREGGGANKARGRKPERRRSTK